MVLVQESLQETWDKPNCLMDDPLRRSKWEIFFSCTCWGIWKERNLRIFENRRRLVDVVAAWIIQEASLWEMFY